MTLLRQGRLRMWTSVALMVLLAAVVAQLQLFTAPVYNLTNWTYRQTCAVFLSA